MRSLTGTLLIPLLLCAGAAFDVAANAQTRGAPGGRGTVAPAPVLIAPGPVSAVRDAPYSAEAITTVTQTLGDGTKIERSVTANVFRDGMGRTRREQTVLGLASLAPSADAVRVITITDPVARVTYTLDEQTRTARQTPVIELRFFERTTAAQPIQPQAFRLGRQGGAGPDTAAMGRVGELLDQLASRRGGPDDRDRQLADLASQLVQQPPGGGNTGVVANLGTRQMEQLTVTGRRTTQTIPAGAVGNDRPIEIVDETWESPDLQVVISSRHVDPRTGTIEYRLANVRRGEPQADLFVVPSGYTVIGGAAISNVYGRGLAPVPPLPAPPASPAAPPGRSGLPLPPGVPTPAVSPGTRGRGTPTPFGASTQSATPSIFVVGEGGRPGSYAFEPGMTVQQALDRASTAMPRNGRVALIRNGREWATAAEASTPLQPGDVLMVLSKK